MSNSPAVLILQPSKSLVVKLNLSEVWAYRELLFFLIWRVVKVRYKQTALGAAWAILQPVMTMMVFGVFFGRLAKIAFTALLPWHLFAYASGLIIARFASRGPSSCANCRTSSRRWTSQPTTA